MTFELFAAASLFRLTDCMVSYPLVFIYLSCVVVRKVRRKIIRRILYYSLPLYKDLQTRLAESNNYEKLVAVTEDIKTRLLKLRADSELPLEPSSGKMAELSGSSGVDQESARPSDSSEIAQSGTSVTTGPGNQKCESVVPPGDSTLETTTVAPPTMPNSTKLETRPPSDSNLTSTSPGDLTLEPAAPINSNLSQTPSSGGNREPTPPCDSNTELISSSSSKVEALTPIGSLSNKEENCIITSSEEPAAKRARIEAHSSETPDRTGNENVSASKADEPGERGERTTETKSGDAVVSSTPTSESFPPVWLCHSRPRSCVVKR